MQRFHGRSDFPRGKLCILDQSNSLGAVEFMINPCSVRVGATWEKLPREQTMGAHPPPSYDPNHSEQLDDLESSFPRRPGTQSQRIRREASTVGLNVITSVHKIRDP
jgi:hypothetical protein